ncbi:MAG: chemotaxis protein CheX [Candidatus Muiribacteriota bacterium]
MFETVDRVFIEVLEESAFTFADPLEEKDQLESLKHEDFFITYITFSGDVNGDVFMLLTHETARDISINMMGIDEEDFDPSYVEDATMEIANMLCGKVVTELFGKEKLYDISIPVINTGREELFEKLFKDKNTRFFLIEDKPALINIKF